MKRLPPAELLLELIQIKSFLHSKIFCDQSTYRVKKIT